MAYKPQAPKRGSTPRKRGASSGGAAAKKSARAASESRSRMKQRILKLEALVSTLQSGHKELIIRLLEDGKI